MRNLSSFCGVSKCAAFMQIRLTTALIPRPGNLALRTAPAAHVVCKRWSLERQSHLVADSDSAVNATRHIRNSTACPLSSLLSLQPGRVTSLPIYNLLREGVYSRPIVEVMSFVGKLYTALRVKINVTRMWANAQPDGRPAEHRWRPLFNAAKFG